MVSKDSDVSNTLSEGGNVLHIVNATQPKHFSALERNENIVATFVDIASIMVAYRLGIEQFGTVAAVTYALFDAYIVIWQRKRIASLIRRLFNFIAN